MKNNSYLDDAFNRSPVTLNVLLRLGVDELISVSSQLPPLNENEVKALSDKLTFDDILRLVETPFWNEQFQKLDLMYWKEKLLARIPVAKNFLNQLTSWKNIIDCYKQLSTQLWQLTKHDDDLANAIKNDDIALLQSIIKPDKEELYNDLMLIAALLGSYKTIFYLLENTATWIDKTTLLQLMQFINDDTMIKIIDYQIAAQFDPNTTMIDDDLFLNYLLKQGYEKIAIHLIKHNTQFDFAIPNQLFINEFEFVDILESPFFIAIEKNLNNAVEAFINLNVNINRQVNGKTALHRAIEVGNLTAANVLLNHPQISLVITDYDDRSALDYALTEKEFTLAIAMIKKMATGNLNLIEPAHFKNIQQSKFATKQNIPISNMFTDTLDPKIITDIKKAVDDVLSKKNKLQRLYWTLMVGLNSMVDAELKTIPDDFKNSNDAKSFFETTLRRKNITGCLLFLKHDVQVELKQIVQLLKESMLQNDFRTNVIINYLFNEDHGFKADSINEAVRAMLESVKKETQLQINPENIDAIQKHLTKTSSAYKQKL